MTPERKLITIAYQKAKADWGRAHAVDLASSGKAETAIARAAVDRKTAEAAYEIYLVASKNMYDTESS